MTTLSLAPQYGRVLGINESTQEPAHIVPNLVVDDGLSALAVSGRALDVTATGVDLVRNVTGAGTGHFLGEKCGTVAGPVVVLATSRRAASMYRRAFLGSDRIVVVETRPWDGKDLDYWGALRAICAPAGLTVIDRVQGLANGNFLSAHANALAGFGGAVVGFYQGAETKPGIGGDIGWFDAVTRAWIGAKRELHLLDTDVPPRQVTLPQMPTDPAGFAGVLRLTGDQVFALGQLGRKVDGRAKSPRMVLGLILSVFWDEAVRICQSADLTVTKLAEAQIEHSDRWDAGLSATPFSPPFPDEPPF